MFFTWKHITVGSQLILNNTLVKIPYKPKTSVLEPVLSTYWLQNLCCGPGTVLSWSCTLYHDPHFTCEITETQGG